MVIKPLLEEAHKFDTEFSRIRTKVDHSPMAKGSQLYS